MQINGNSSGSPSGDCEDSGELKNSEISLVRLLQLVSLRMAYNSNSKSNLDDDDNEEEEFEHFDDFTVASSWERFNSPLWVHFRNRSCVSALGG